MAVKAVAFFIVAAIELVFTVLCCVCAKKSMEAEDRKAMEEEEEEMLENAPEKPSVDINTTPAYQ